MFSQSYLYSSLRIPGFISTHRLRGNNCLKRTNQIMNFKQYNVTITTMPQKPQVQGIYINDNDILSIKHVPRDTILKNIKSL